MARSKRYSPFPQPVRFSFSPVARRIPNPEGPLPPLPDPIPDPFPYPIPYPEPIHFLSEEPLRRLYELEWPKRIWPMFRGLREGCYLIRYTPLQVWQKGFFHYDGTMRVQRDGTNTIASGDLYLHSLYPLRPSSPEPNPAAGIPIFPRAQYRYYLRVTKILEWYTLANSFTLEFELHRFDHTTNAWTNTETCTARMTWTAAPQGYPSSSDYLTGEVKNSSGAVVGGLTMGWVSQYLRRAVVEVDRVSQSEAPLENGSGIDWLEVFDQVGWDVDLVVSDSMVEEASGESWSNAELHREMLNWRDPVSLDTEWRYHLLCVRRLDATSRGIMYDAYGGDSNNVPREGAAISSHWTIPNTATWGLVAGMRFGEATAPYFRTAVHEIGHAQGLYHNTVDNGLMNTTGTIAASATPPVQFPNNVQWSHASDDQKRLRHMPDIWVRPGGIPFGQSYNTTPISPDDMFEYAEGLELQVSSLLETVPIGAPVRINFKLVNTVDQAVMVPASLSLKAGHVQGKVVGPTGVVRTFRPLIICIEDDELHSLEPGRSMTHSLTLLRGAQGALFPSPGVYRVIVEVSWHVHGTEVGIMSEVSVMITPPVDEAHAVAALKILSCPDALLTLAIGGDHLQEGVEAIGVAMGNPVLRPHYAIVEAKRLGNRFGRRKGDFEAACRLIDDKAILSGSEIKRAAEIVQSAGPKAKGEEGKQIVKILKDKIKHAVADEGIVKAVESL